MSEQFEIVRFVTVLALLLMAACHHSPTDDPMMYTVTADETGRAVIMVDGYTFGDFLDVTAYKVHRINADADPWYEQLDGVMFLLDGSVCVDVDPLDEVVFIIDRIEGKPSQHTDVNGGES